MLNKKTFLAIVFIGLIDSPVWAATTTGNPCIDRAAQAHDEVVQHAEGVYTGTIPDPNADGGFDLMSCVGGWPDFGIGIGLPDIWNMIKNAVCNEIRSQIHGVLQGAGTGFDYNKYGVRVSARGLVSPGSSGWSQPRIAPAINSVSGSGGSAGTATKDSSTGHSFWDFIK